MPLQDRNEALRGLPGRGPRTSSHRRTRALARDLELLLLDLQAAARRATGSRSQAGAPSGSALEPIERALASAVTLARAVVERDRERRRTIDLARLVHDARPILDLVLGPDIEVEVHAPAGPMPIAAEPLEIQRLLLHLAWAARDAMPGGGRCAVAVSGRRVDAPSSSVPPGAYVVLQVSDSATGRSPGEQDAAQDPLRSSTCSAPGVAEVHRILERAGAVMRVESAVSRGTTFHIYFPDAGGDGNRTRRSGREPAAR